MYIFGGSTSWNPQGLSRPVMGFLFYIFGGTESDRSHAIQSAIYSIQTEFNRSLFW
jgi:hypothetical protein